MLPGTASSWQPGETTAVRLPTKAERSQSRHVQPPPGRRGHQGCRAARWRHDQRRRCSRSETPMDLDVGGLLECLSEVLWRSDWGNDTSKRITETKFAPERATSAVDGGVGLCALTSSLRTPTELRRSGLTATYAVVQLEDQPTLSCSSPPYLRPVHAPVSARRDEAGNAPHYVSSGVPRNRLWRWRSRVHSWWRSSRL